MKYKYKNNEFDISLCEGDWGEHTGWFHVKNEQPFDFGYTQTFDEMKMVINKKCDEYYSKIPKNDKEWIGLFESCVIRDGYEDWHIDEKLAMRLLNLYKDTR